MEGNQLFGYYNNNEPKNITNQSDQQKYSLKNFLSNKINDNPWIFNFIYLENLSKEQYYNIGLNKNTNILYKNFSLDSLFNLAFDQCKLYKYNNYLLFSSYKKNDFLEKIFIPIEKIFSERKNFITEITRKKLEIITKKILDPKVQEYSKNIGEKMVIINGRAGTGKTIKLLRIANDLCLRDKKVLILTYNTALVSDIKRLIHLSNMGDDFEYGEVDIKTIYKFIYEISEIYIFNKDILFNNKNISDKNLFLDNYENILEYLTNTIKNDNLYHWNFIMIDEAQDWKIKERDFLYKMFGYKKIIIADGIDQLIRSHSHSDWTINGLIPNFKKTPERKSLRQKNNLINFINIYSNKINLSWNLELNDELSGGKVILINDQDFNEKFFIFLNKELTNVKNSGGGPYEMMFLCPPSMVKNNSFTNLKQFKENNFELWDGTNKDLRSIYPDNPDMFRLFQYDSCRGLESWTLVCLWLDEFIKWKLDYYHKHENEIQNNDLGLYSKEEKIKDLVYLWTNIILTRAIDTLIITIKDKNSYISQVIEQIAKENKDMIQVINTKN